MSKIITSLSLIDAKKYFINNHIYSLKSDYYYNNNSIKNYLFNNKDRISKDIIRNYNNNILSNSDEELNKYPILQHYLELQKTLNYTINIGEIILKNDLK